MSKDNGYLTVIIEAAKAIQRFVAGVTKEQFLGNEEKYEAVNRLPQLRQAPRPGYRVRSALSNCRFKVKKGAQQACRQTRGFPTGAEPLWVEFFPPRLASPSCSLHSAQDSLNSVMISTVCAQLVCALD